MAWLICWLVLFSSTVYYSSSSGGVGTGTGAEGEGASEATNEVEVFVVALLSAGLLNVLTSSASLRCVGISVFF